ncbi:hypothetical protein [Leuconostoc miyukkimchii]|uniref:hypothetical protein n=1 Tax=Leuconostoc miyukkimchii TaxID=910540 RepID=UPI001C7D186D|nr:hypothetical protein [Leuconostoc miyukkimchii]
MNNILIGEINMITNKEQTNDKIFDIALGLLLISSMLLEGSLSTIGMTVAVLLAIYSVEN